MSSTLKERPTSSPEPGKGAPQSDIWTRRLAIGLPILVLTLVLVVANQIGGVLIAQDLRDDYADLLAEGQQLTAPAAQPDAAAPAGAAEPATPPDVRPEVTIAASLTQFAIELDVEEIPAWANVTFNVVNDGQTPHDLSIEGGPATRMLNPGETATITDEAKGAGTVHMICTVPGHEAAGMRVALPVAAEEGAAPAAAPAAGDVAAAAADAASPANAAAYTGDKPPLELRDPTAPEPLQGTVHDITWTIEEKVVQGTINPGEEILYSFTATHAGVFMYHCGTAPALHHIGNGMYGAVIVEPKGGLPEVDHESPAQGGYAEFTLAEDGLYPIVTHAFNHVGRGALGLFKAGTGGEAAAGGH